MQDAIYLVVADSSQAHVYLTDTALSTLELVVQQQHPSSRLTRSELDSDKPGSSNSGGRGYHSLGGDSSSHQHESSEFARSLGKYLHSEHLAHKFGQLLIAAPPHFLGELRQHLSDDCQKVLGKTVNKNLLHMGTAEMLEHFV
jgi:protein required for attachment to host cells